MKKILLTFLVLFCTITGYAQIKLEHTFDCGIGSSFLFRLPYYEDYTQVSSVGFKRVGFVWGNIVVVNNTKILDLDTNKEYIWEIPQYSQTVAIAKGFFTDDDRICFVVDEEDIYKATDERNHYYIYDINHNVIQDLGIGYHVSCGIIRLSEGQCKFYICRYHYDKKCEFEIYSLSGNGNTTDMDVMPDSHHSSVRKYFHNDQVLIESDDRTYNLQGKQVF
jgi:hypothetical protein